MFCESAVASTGRAPCDPPGSIDRIGSAMTGKHGPSQPDQEGFGHRSGSSAVASAHESRLAMVLNEAFPEK